MRLALKILLVLICFIGVPIGIMGNLKIWTVHCQYQSAECDTEITQKLQAFQGKYLFFTQVESDFQSLLPDYTLVHYQKQLPGTLNLTLEAPFLGTAQAIPEALFAGLPEEIIDQLEPEITYLPKTPVSIALTDKLLIIEFDSPLRAIIDRSNLKVGMQRLVQVLHSVDVKSIDTAIKEIDTRYRLPVLRTEYTIE